MRDKKMVLVICYPSTQKNKKVVEILNHHKITVMEEEFFHSSSSMTFAVICDGLAHLSRQDEPPVDELSCSHFQEINYHDFLEQYG